MEGDVCCCRPRESGDIETVADDGVDRWRLCGVEPSAASAPCSRSAARPTAAPDWERSRHERAGSGTLTTQTCRLDPARDVVWQDAARARCLGSTKHIKIKIVQKVPKNIQPNKIIIFQIITLF